MRGAPIHTVAARWWALAAPTLAAARLVGPLPVSRRPPGEATLRPQRWQPFERLSLTRAAGATLEVTGSFYRAAWWTEECFTVDALTRLVETQSRRADELQDAASLKSVVVEIRHDDVLLGYAAWDAPTRTARPLFRVQFERLSPDASTYALPLFDHDFFVRRAQRAIRMRRAITDSAPSALAPQLSSAASPRYPFGADTTAFRAVNGSHDGLPGVHVDIFGVHAIVSIDAASSQPLVLPVLSALRSELGTLNGILRCTSRPIISGEHSAAEAADDVRREPYLGGAFAKTDADRLESVMESGALFRPLSQCAWAAAKNANDAFSMCGAVPDVSLRLLRRYVHQNCRDKVVLCLYDRGGLAATFAALGGARAVMSCPSTPHTDAKMSAAVTYRLNCDVGSHCSVTDLPTIASLKQALSSSPKTRRNVDGKCLPPDVVVLDGSAMVDDIGAVSRQEGDRAATAPSSSVSHTSSVANMWWNAVRTAIQQILDATAIVPRGNNVPHLRKPAMMRVIASMSQPTAQVVYSAACAVSRQTSGTPDHAAVTAAWVTRRIQEDSLWTESRCRARCTDTIAAGADFCTTWSEENDLAELGECCSDGQPDQSNAAERSMLRSTTCEFHVRRVAGVVIDIESEK